jgi:hypothetical protein
MDRLWRLLLAGAAAVVLVATLVRVPIFWSNEAYHDLASGVWFGLADDLTHGVFYRPVVSPEGFGGTRYFPVQIVLHGGLTVLLGGHILAAARVLTALAMIGLLSAVVTLLRRLGATRLLAASCAILILAAQPVQQALLSFRGDLLPAAFNIWGVALCAAPALGPGAAVAAGALFALAFGTKLTTVFGAAAAVAFLWFSGRRRPAMLVLGATATGIVILSVYTLAASHGRVVDAWWAAASTGSGIRQLLLAPFAFARAVRKVPETLAFIQLGIAALLALTVRRRTRIDLSSWLFLATLAVTAVIFAAEGTDTNHLVDLQVASLLVVGVWIASASDDAKAFGHAVLVVAGLAASMSLVSGIINRNTEDQRGTARDVAALVGDTSKPILAENALISVAAGQRAYMLDPYMFTLLRQGNPTMTDAFFRDLDTQRFSAVVLDRDPHTDRGRVTYGTTLFGEGFVERMEQNYVEAGRVKNRVIYKPKLP